MIFVCAFTMVFLLAFISNALANVYNECAPPVIFIFRALLLLLAAWITYLCGLGMRTLQ